MKIAAYYRSSKDAHEIGLPTQRRDIADWARSQGHQVVAEFEDMAISGSEDITGRPGLRAMLESANRHEFEGVVAIDTSRIARDPMIALFVTRELERVDVKLLYVKIDVDASTAMGEMVLGVLRQFDRLHSRLSAEKGKAGQITNVLDGARAGGRAPSGYLIDRSSGKPRLVIDPASAKPIGEYLNLRSEGIGRALAARQSGLAKTDQGSLRGFELNALTYAGYTVWNRAKKKRPTRDDPTRTMIPRPRSEWLVSEAPTHDAVISRIVAEKVLDSIERRVKVGGPRGVVRSTDPALLRGVLRLHTGERLDHSGDYYRVEGKGRRVLRRTVDALFLKQLRADIADPRFVDVAIQSAKALAKKIRDEVPPEADQLAKVNSMIANLADVIAKTGNATLVEKLSALEKEKEGLAAVVAEHQRNIEIARNLEAVTPRMIRTMITFSIPDGDEVIDADGDGPMRKVVERIIDRVEYDFDRREIKVAYRFSPRGEDLDLASRRGFEPL